MHANKTIHLRGLEKKDQMVFSSLLSLLSLKTTDEWTIGLQENSDAIVVDFDLEEGQRLANSLERTGKKVILYGNHPRCRQHPLWLGKPLRATDMLRCLKEIETISTTGKTHADPDDQSHNQSHNQSHDKSIYQQPAPAVRLKRWPDRELCRAYPGAIRLCAVLMKHSVTVEKAALMAGLPYQRAADFVAKCKERNYIEEKPIEIIGIHQTVNSNNQKTKLFDRLRHKFRARA